MLKKRLYNPPQISAILSRPITSTDFTPSIPVSHCCNSSVSNSPSLFSSLFSSSSSSSSASSSYNNLKWHDGKPSPSGRCLFYPSHARDDAGSSLRIQNFFCSQSKPAENLHCWNCGDESVDTTAFLFCDACRSVQPVDESIDFFRIFGLERKYQIELEELEKKYKDWQKKLHPDLVHSKSQREREYAAEQSARVINAYRTLTDPLSRAIYIVKLEGAVVDEEERITDPTLLPEVMELREAVDEAEDTQALKKIQAQLQEKLRYCWNSFEDAYRSKNYDDALASIRRMTYYKRANEEIVKKL